LIAASSDVAGAGALVIVRSPPSARSARCRPPAAPPPRFHRRYTFASGDTRDRAAAETESACTNSARESATPRARALTRCADCARRARRAKCRGTTRKPCGEAKETGRALSNNIGRWRGDDPRRLRRQSAGLDAARERLVQSAQP